MFKGLFAKKGPTEAELRSMAESAQILRMRMERLVQSRAFRETFEAHDARPAGAGTVSKATLAAKAQALLAAPKAA